MPSAHALKIEAAFKQLCMSVHEEPDAPMSSGSPTSIPISVTIPLGKAFDLESDAGLTKEYPQAFTDFYPSKAGCVYKSGPAWPIRTGPQEQAVVREARPVFRPDLAPTWVSTLQRITQSLDALGVNVTSINPFGFANEGEDDAFCPFLLYVGVTPRSLTYKIAAAAAVDVKAVLAGSGLPEVEVAFVELVNKRSTRPKLLSLEPVLNDVPEYRKPFSATLGLPIALCEAPLCEGTGGLYLRLSGDPKDERIALLTCAHVVRPPHIFSANTGMSRTDPNQPKEYMVALGYRGYDKAVADMVAEIARQMHNINVWNTQLTQIPPTHPKYHEITAEVDKATRRINSLNDLHTEVTKYRSIKAQRTIGWALHSSPVKVGVEPLGYMEDWGLVELDLEQIDMKTFPGNKIFIGTSFFPFLFSLFSLSSQPFADCRLVFFFFLPFFPFPLHRWEVHSRPVRRGHVPQS